MPLQLNYEKPAARSPQRIAAIRALCEKLNTMGVKSPGSRLPLNLAMQFHEPFTNPEGVCQEFSRLAELNREMRRSWRQLKRF